MKIVSVSRRILSWVLCMAIVMPCWTGIARSEDGDSGAAKCRSIVGAEVCESKIPDVSGTYSGTINDAIGGAGSITVSVEQKGRSLTGLWSTSYPHAAGLSGTLTGTVSKTAIEAKLTTPYARCFYHVIATIGAASFAGTFSDTRHCPEDDSGSFTLNRS